MVDYTPSSAVDSGDICQVGGYLAIAHDDIAANATGPVHVEGVFSVTKAAGTAWTAGQRIYYDATNSNFTPTQTGNQFAGLAFKAAASAATTGYVDLNKGQGHDGVADADFTIGAEAANSINVAIQLKDADGNDIDHVAQVWAHLSDAATGIGVCATAPDGDIAVGTDGAILGELVADKVFLLQSENDGDIDLDIGEAGGDTWYLAIMLPNGRIIVSGAITFAS